MYLPSKLVNAAEDNQTAPGHLDEIKKCKRNGMQSYGIPGSRSMPRPKKKIIYVMALEFDSSIRNELKKPGKNVQKKKTDVLVYENLTAHTCTKRFELWVLIRRQSRREKAFDVCAGWRAGSSGLMGLPHGMINPSHKTANSRVVLVRKVNGLKLLPYPLTLSADLLSFQRPTLSIAEFDGIEMGSTEATE
ncbi:hypothetical protein FISHEDRAFT_56859 [Fistulina hepatica ATCC 64428]|uniref:Uncharacterized protein n=1 Tax=Fistulina hepatica ATCC 64428 TaxID=1128425 RepID=A0A0D7AJ80_9AGAR|nr:hypothetical protein FISHEDRAFT_56859 [Fistulina hepatica ATCC 64428]